MPAESRLQTAIVKAMRAQGYYAVVNHGSAYTGAGRPDITVDAHGTAAWIEVKTESGRLTPRQKAEISKIRRQGGYAFVARTVRAALLGVSLACQGRLHMAEEKEWSIDDFLKDLDAPVLTEDQMSAPDPLDWEPVDAPADTISPAVMGMMPQGDTHGDGENAADNWPDNPSFGGYSDLPGDPEPEPVPAIHFRNGNVIEMAPVGDDERLRGHAPVLDLTELFQDEPISPDLLEYANRVDSVISSALPVPEAVVDKAVELFRPTGVLEGISWDLAMLLRKLERIESLLTPNSKPAPVEDDATVIKRRRGRPPKAVAE